MALNFSHRPIFQSHMSEENVVSPMKTVNGYIVEGIPEKGESYVLPHVDDCFHYGRDIVDRGGSQESVSNDIIDLLPSDPFGMDISSTVKALTGWFEDWESDYGGYGGKNVGAGKEEYSLFAGLNYIWNTAMRLQSYPGDTLFGDKYNTACASGSYVGNGGFGVEFYQGGYGVGHNAEEKVCFKNGSTSAITNNVEVKNVEGFADADGRAPHEAFSFALSYLGLKDLLAVEMVCKSLHSAVRSDPLLWRNIHIDLPLNERITDDVLSQLTCRTQGNLQCLSLVECPRITDDGLKRMLDANPKLTKLCVPGCTRLSIEGILNSLKALKSNTGSPGIKHLRIGGLYGVTIEHFEELKLLLGADCHPRQIDHKPHFYRRGNLYLLCDDERAIDIEVCPQCEKLRLVYDCPAKSCQVKDNTSQACRACVLCIARCIQCGRCINNSEYEESFCLELFCRDCFKQALKCQEQYGEVGFTENSG